MSNLFTWADRRPGSGRAIHDRQTGHRAAPGAAGEAADGDDQVLPVHVISSGLTPDVIGCFPWDSNPEPMD